MSDTNVEGLKEEEVAADSDSLQKQIKEKCVQEQDGENHGMEEIIKKKYGGILPKKPPLISKDHERAFFDSADWALGKQGAQKPKGPLEALRPKLQPTPHQQVRSRRSAYAPAGEEDGDGDGDGDGGGDDEDNNTCSEEGQSCAVDCFQNNDTTGDEKSSH